MATAPHDEPITILLQAWRGGDESALTAMMPLVYDRLKEIAQHVLGSKRGQDTLQATALVHEAYLRIIPLDRIGWQDRAHFFAMSARLMRRVLVDHARHHSRAKRGGNDPVVTIDELTPAKCEETHQLLEVDEALRELARHDSQMAHIVELRFFGGLNRDEIAEVLGISSATATRRWRTARAWLMDFLSEESR